MKKVEISINEYLPHGYSIITKPNCEEFILVRMVLDLFGNVYYFNEICRCKYKKKLINVYEKEVKKNINKDIIHNFNETIQDLTIDELKAMFPSFYYMEINAKIIELQNKKYDKHYNKDSQRKLFQKTKRVNRKSDT
jgi:hypothetical protein